MVCVQPEVLEAVLFRKYNPAELEAMFDKVPLAETVIESVSVLSKEIPVGVFWLV